jgi:hypothetical protein
MTESSAAAFLYMAGGAVLGYLHETLASYDERIKKIIREGFESIESGNPAHDRSDTYARKQSSATPLAD